MTPRRNFLRDLMDGFDASTPDGLLHELADAGATDITIRSVPRRARHGSHAVRWSHDGRQHTAEGATLATALRAALRAAGGRCAGSEP